MIDKNTLGKTKAYIREEVCFGLFCLYFPRVKEFEIYSWKKQFLSILTQIIYTVSIKLPLRNILRL